MIMKVLRGLSGSGSKEPARHDAVDYKGFSIVPTPRQVTGGWTTEGIISMGSGEDARSDGDRGLEILLVDGEKDVTLVEEPAAAELWRDGDDATGHFGNEGARSAGADGSASGDVDPVVGALERHDIDDGIVLRGFASLRFGLVGDERPVEQGRSSEDNERRYGFEEIHLAARFGRRP